MANIVSEVWYSKKNAFEQAQKKHRGKFGLARDSVENAGSKAYTWFPDHRSLITHIADAQGLCPRFHEVLYFDTPCLLFFDIDRHILPDEDYDISLDGKDTIINTFLLTLHRFLVLLYALPESTKFDIGSNCQVLDSSRPTKLSMHIRIDIKCKSVAIMYNIAKNFEKYVLSNVHCSPKETDTLTYIYQNALKALVDTSPYRLFGLFRTAYSTKWVKECTPFIPYGNSSKDIAKHLVVHSVRTCKNPIYTIDIPVEFTAKADYSKLNDMTMKPICVKRSPEERPTLNPRQSRASHTKAYKAKRIPELEQFVSQSMDLQKKLQVDGPITLEECYFYNPYLYNMMIKKSCSHFCPYACRTHRHNRSYFQYNTKTRVLTYKCFSQKNNCHEQQDICYKLNRTNDTLSKLSDLNAATTLHCKTNVISWDESYCEPSMLPYPDKPIIVIKGQMGVGKTTALKDSILHDTKGKSVLFITYQRLLAYKYHHDLADKGFVNYLDFEKESTVTGDKVIVCLDSLCKVQRKQFDYVIVDEATSVLIHFNSQHIRDSNAICARFEQVLLLSKHLVFLDACADNTIVHDVVNKIASRKQVKPYYIRNTYVRPTNRIAEIRVVTQPKAASVLIVDAIAQVIRLLKEGKRVVVPSSTKSFVKDLHNEIIETFGQDKKVGIYHSDMPQMSAADTLNGVNDWDKLDVLLYSPSISAGISFERLHFDHVVGFFLNSEYTPSVDNVLQQLFRVRQLREGSMTLYVDNSGRSKDAAKYPIASDDIDARLDKDLDSTNSYFKESGVNYHSPPAAIDYEELDFENPDSEANMIRYNKDSISYLILRGIITNKNKSKQHFVTILKSMLEQDYSIPCTLINLTPEKDEVKQANMALGCIKEMRTEVDIPFTKELIIDQNHYEHLTKLAESGEQLTDFEKQQVFTYYVVFELYGIRRKNLNQSFYDNYVGQVTNQKEALDRFYKFKRMASWRDHHVDYHIKKYKDKLASLCHASNGESAIELYKGENNKHHPLVIEGQKFGDAVLPHFDFDKETHDVIEGAEFHEKTKVYLNSLSNDEYDRLARVLDDGHHNTFKKRENVMKSDRSLAAIEKTLLDAAFGVNIQSIRTGLHNTTFKHLTSDFASMMNEFQPDSLKKQIRIYDIDSD